MPYVAAWPKAGRDTYTRYLPMQDAINKLDDCSVVEIAKLSKIGSHHVCYITALVQVDVSK